MRISLRNCVKSGWRLVSLALLASGTVGCTQYSLLSQSLFMMTPTQEQQLGVQVAQKVEQQHALVRDPIIEQYVKDVGQRIWNNSPQRDITPRFFVLNDPTINAFAIPGGNVYVQTGLLNAADDEAELAAVIAHEVGHVISRHSAQQVANETGIKMIEQVLIGNDSPQTARVLTNLAEQIPISSFSRADEAEADTIAVQTLYNAGYDPHALTRFFGKLKTQSADPGAVANFFSTHPATSDRIAAVDQMVRALPKKQLAAPVTELRRAQGRLQELGLGAQ